MSSTQLPVPLLIFLVLFPSACLARNSLYVDDTLFATQSLNYNAYRFVMQPDCNLVLYDNNRLVWASETYRKGYNCRAVMQSDGNFVIYTPENDPVWATNTVYGTSDYELILQSDRNVVIYDDSVVIWATNTNVVGAGVTIAPRKNVTFESEI